MQQAVSIMRQWRDDRIDRDRPAATSISAILDTVRRLADADGADLLRRDPLSGNTRAFAGTTAATSLKPSAVNDGQREAFEVGTAHWIDRTIDGGATLAVMIERRGPRELLLVLTFRDPSDETKRRALQIAPELHSLLRIHLKMRARVRALRRDARLTLVALHQCETGILVMRADHSVAFSNAAADAILDADNGLRRRGGTVRPLEYHDAVRFYTAIDCVMSDVASARSARAAGRVMLLPRPRHERPMIAVIVPATAAAAIGEAAAIVYLMTPDQDISRGLEPICQLHGLSPAETRLTGHLISGFSLTEAANEMRIKPETARTYLKQIFAKTRTHRQADLVRLLLRYMRAVRGPSIFHAA